MTEKRTSSKVSKKKSAGKPAVSAVWIRDDVTHRLLCNPSPRSKKLLPK